jgi:hypothetical protein
MIVKSTQFHEYAANPAAVTFTPTEAIAQDWLIQPIAADSVAEGRYECAICPGRDN